MIAATITALTLIVAVATGLSLVDSWMRGRQVYAVLKREKALLDAGFLPQVHAHETRLRKPARRTLASATRPYARRTPLPTFHGATQKAA